MMWKPDIILSPDILFDNLVLYVYPKGVMRLEIEKLLLVSPLPPPAGGIASWTQKYINHLSGSVSVRVVDTSVTGKRSDAINGAYHYPDEIKRTLKIVKDLKIALSEEKPDLVHINTSCSPLGIIREYLCVRIANRFKIPVVLHCRCNISDQLGGSRAGHYFFKKAVNKSALILVLNSQSLDFVQNISNKKCVRVNNFIENDFILTEKKEINPIIHNIAFVGHVCKDKGIAELIDAAKILPDIRFMLAGSISNEIKAITVSDNLYFLGEKDKDDIKKLLDSSDLFVFPSYTEGFSNALLEAMARGMPVIATDVGTNADMLENKGGIIIETKNTKAIAEAVLSLNNPELRKEMSEWNIEKVKNSYTLLKVADDLMRLYTEAV